MYPVKKMLLTVTIFIPMTLIVSLVVAKLIGFSFIGLMFFILVLLPVLIFSTIYGFYKGLVRRSGLKGKEKLFWGGRF